MREKLKRHRLIRNQVILAGWVFMAAGYLMAKPLVAVIGLGWLSIYAFVLMWMDKRSAGAGTMRIPEATLWLIALLGGSIGTWIGMLSLRHKTRHAMFVWGIPSLMVLQIAAVCYVFLTYQ